MQPFIRRPSSLLTGKSFRKPYHDLAKELKYSTEVQKAGSSARKSSQLKIFVVVVAEAWAIENERNKAL